MNRIVSAEPLPDCRLKVTFNDGVSGIFPVEPERRGGVFLNEVLVFNDVELEVAHRELARDPDFGDLGPRTEGDSCGE